MNNLITRTTRIKLSERNRKSGFTLVEVLIVMVIIASMGGMIVAAVQGVTTTAREARTKQIIAACDAVIQEQYESFKYRALPVEIPALFVVTSPTTQVGYEVLATEAARVRLAMVRDLQRMEMPNRYEDFLNGPIPISAACNLVQIDPSGDILQTRDQNIRRESKSVNWNDSPRRRNYRDRYDAVVASFPSPPSTTHQSSECLYLIMATTFHAGSPAIDAIPSANIADTDNDGMLEILDGWGRPLGFIRWPVGYADPDGSLDVNVPDDFDLFRSDFAYVNGVSATPSSAAVVGAVDMVNGVNNLKPWSLRPLVFSFGDDGLAGIAIDPIDNSGTSLDQYQYSSATWNWPINAANMGDESPGRTGTFRFPDPYMRRFIAMNDPTALSHSATDRRLVGEYLDATNTTSVADNITNYSLRASR